MRTTIPYPLPSSVPLARPFAWATWPSALMLILLVFAARLIYLIWLSPWELVGDEAYYWEWSRHLDWCYYEKGPGLAYLIAASIHLFGTSEWTVRLPVAILSALSAWALGRLAISVTHGDARVGFLTVVCFLLLPAYQANAQICTQDGPIILCWILLSAASLRLVRHWEAGRSTLFDWLLLAFLLGAGFLFKQSILLFLPSLVLYALLQRRRLRWYRGLLLQVLLAAALFLAMMVPILIWNHQHGWPTLAHTLGHLNSNAGDQNAAGERYDPSWMLSFVGAQVGAFGPACIYLMAVACIWAIRSRQTDPDRWPARLWLLCCALPSLAFFFLLSVRKSVLGNWAFPSFATLIVLVAELAAIELPRYHRLLSDWFASPQRPRPKMGFFRRRPETPFRSAWEILIGYGLGGWLLLSFPNWLVHLPQVGKIVENSLLDRIAGHRDRAATLARTLATLQSSDGQPPVLVTRYYMNAALYAFYLPHHPTVYNAGILFGKRPSSYDFWPSTNLSDPSLLGRSMLLVGTPSRPWDQVLKFEQVLPLNDGAYYLGKAYGGTRPHPTPSPTPGLLGSPATRSFTPGQSAAMPRLLLPFLTPRPFAVWSPPMLALRAPPQQLSFAMYFSLPLFLRPLQSLSTPSKPRDSSLVSVPSPAFYYPLTTIHSLLPLCDPCLRLASSPYNS